MSPGGIEPAELERFDNFGDLALFYDDLLRALDIEKAIVVGHSFGGMAAAEFAAYFPNRVSKLVLIGAMGLWDDATPVGDIHTTEFKLAEFLFADPQGPAAAQILRPPTELEFNFHQQLALASAAHFYWPIPDRDLARRLYRITSPTLLVWGAEDRITPLLYAQRFAEGVSGDAKIVEVSGAGHFPHLEKVPQVTKTVLSFADGGQLQLAGV
jgi:pimeloyl-ACP methyl ester carboxylesterase